MFLVLLLVVQIDAILNSYKTRLAEESKTQQLTLGEMCAMCFSHGETPLSNRSQAMRIYDVLSLIMVVYTGDRLPLPILFAPSSSNSAICRIGDAVSTGVSLATPKSF
jgi:hypothetical protein